VPLADIRFSRYRRRKHEQKIVKAIIL